MRAAMGHARPAQTPDLAELVRVVECKTATLRHAYYLAGSVTGWHRHDRPSLSYGVGGPAVETSRGKQLVKRRLTYHPTGFEHAVRMEGPTHVLSVEVEDEYARAHAGMWPDESAPLPATLYDDVWRLLVNCADEAPLNQIDAAMHKLLEDVVSFLGQGTPSRVLEIIDFVHANWRTIPSAAVIAKQFGITPQHLTRTFKRWTGVTLQQYALALRLDYARGLMWGTGLSISEVAAETGFCDQSHLTRALKEHLQHTPSKLRSIVPYEGRDVRLPSR